VTLGEPLIEQVPVAEGLLDLGQDEPDRSRAENEQDGSDEAGRLREQVHHEARVGHQRHEKHAGGSDREHPDLEGLGQQLLRHRTHREDGCGEGNSREEDHIRPVGSPVEVNHLGSPNGKR